MPFQVTLQQTGHRFDVPAGQSVLAAANAAGYTLAYGCRSGSCGACKGKLIEGSVDYGVHMPYTLSEMEKKAGFALFCTAKPLTDIVIDAREIGGMGGIEVRKLPARVLSIEKPATDVVVLKLKLPANVEWKFLAGQYIEFLLRDNRRRAYSMANAPHVTDHVELHLRHMPGGLFTDPAFTTMKEKDILRLEGPMGTFFLREDSAKPIVFVASGTGFAPVKAIIEHMLHQGIVRPMVLYWGGRRPADLYLSELCRQWEVAHGYFTFMPVISDAVPEDAWAGRTGFVHHAVMADFPDLSGHQVYACGAPIVVDSARRDFVEQCGLPPDEFFADSFTPSVDPAAADQG